jgi:hypothetical protein
MKQKKETTNKTISSTTESKSNASWMPFVMFICAFLLYANSISYEYTCDDGRYTFNNVYVEQGISAFSDLVTKGSQEGCEKKQNTYPITDQLFLFHLL